MADNLAHNLEYNDFSDTGQENEGVIGRADEIKTSGQLGQAKNKARFSKADNYDDDNEFGLPSEGMADNNEDSVAARLKMLTNRAKNLQGAAGVSAVGSSDVKNAVDAATSAASGDIGGTVDSGIAMAVKPVAQTVIPSFGLSLIALDLMVIWDMLRSNKIPLWQKLAIIFVSSLYFGLIFVVIVYVYALFEKVSHPLSAVISSAMFI